MVSEFGGFFDKWQHAKGIGNLDVHGEEIKAEVHWFQEETVGMVKFKVKMDRRLNVRFIGETTPLELTNSKIYPVISIEKGWYRIIDDTGEDYLPKRPV